MKDSVLKKIVLVIFGVSALAATYALVHVDSAQHADQKAPATQHSIHEITEQKGRSFLIALPSIPTAGYSWAITTIDEKFIKLIDQKHERFVPEELNDKDFVGGTGTDHFEFKALKKGKTELVLQYGRPWEKDPVEARTYRITIE